MTAPRPALAIAKEQLRLRHLELDRAAMCQVVGIVDDETADLPLFVANMMAKQRRLADVVRVIGTEVGP